MGELLLTYWQEFTGWFTLLDVLITGGMIAWILSIKKESNSAIAWCLTVLMMPVIGPILFYVFGYQTVYRPIRRKRLHEERYRQTGGSREPGRDEEHPRIDPYWEPIARLARRLDAYRLTSGNAVEFYHEGAPAYEAMLQAIRQAQHHVHIEFFIYRSDASGDRFIEALAERAKAGVQVRLLVDGLGSYSLRRRTIAPLLAAGGQYGRFMPILNTTLSRMRINLRNHRKILVVDGRVGFCGGLNIGDEYLGLDPHYGPWRDTHYRVEGPAVTSLQRVFLEDWDFAMGEPLELAPFLPDDPPNPRGQIFAQVLQSGPHQHLKSIREVYFAAIVRARQRIWIATPYFVPDVGLLDALANAGRNGLDVRLLCPFRPDKWVPFLAARYYWTDMLAAGVKVYQYTHGFMHNKMLLIDGEFASVGTANFDNRSLHLNYEVTTLFYGTDIATELEQVFQADLQKCIRIDPVQYQQRPFVSRLAENACRLLSPIL